jgi:hypothetical protein
MIVRRRIETNSFQRKFFSEIYLVTSGFDTGFALLNQRDAF